MENFYSYFFSKLYRIILTKDHEGLNRSCLLPRCERRDREKRRAERAFKLVVEYMRVPTRNAVFCTIKPNVLLQSRFALPSCRPVVSRKCLDPLLTFYVDAFGCTVNDLINDD